MKRKLPDELSSTLEITKPTAGWNFRPRTVQKIKLGNCTLYVVPFRRWAARRFAKTTLWRDRTGS